MLVNSLNFTFAFCNTAYYTNLEAKENKQGEVHIFLDKYSKNFQIHKVTIYIYIYIYIYKFERTNYDIHLSFLFQILRKFFSCACNMNQ